MAEMYPRTMSDAEVDILIPKDGTVSGGIGENLLYKLLKRYLPADWCVIWNAKHINTDAEHQYDFLVLAKDMGVLVLDAKGHNIGYSDQGVLGRFRQENGEKVFCPDPQMFNNVKGAAESLRNNYLRQEFGNFGACNCLVVFIDKFISTKKDGAVPPDEMGWIDMIEQRLGEDPDCLTNRIKERLSATVNGTDLRNFHRNFTNEKMSAIKEVFCRRNGWEIYFQDDFYRWDCQSRDYLSTRQTIIFDRACGVQAMHIRGAAGTGKTILAMSLARHYAHLDEPKKVLYVCYNRNLANRLGKITSGPGWKNISVKTYDSIGSLVLPTGHRVDSVMQWVRPNRLGWGGAQYRAERERIRQQLDLPKAQELMVFDVVIVDEAQDLDNALIYSLIRFVRKDGKFFVFSDEGQAIYAYSEWKFAQNLIFAGMNSDSMTLTENWRNTIQIHGHYRELGCDQSEASFRGRIEPQEIARNEVQAKLASLLAEGRRPKNIALLSIAGADMSQFVQAHSHNGGVSMPVQIADKLDRWYADECILKSSVEGFKGLEADIVILFGDKDLVNGSDEAKACRTMDRYVGESRAKYELYIVRD